MHLLIPACRSCIWGGTLLKSRFGKGEDLDVVAESWELSTHPDGLTLLPDGESLRDRLKREPAAGGVGVTAEGDLPILVKLIDAREPLSVQVHPDDDYAARVGQRGKTELWHVLAAEPGAWLYLGVKETVSRQELACRIEDGTVEQLLKKVPVKAGESYYIPAGTLHAIGPGCLIYEVQQSSNLTYRVYDYGRPGADGAPRPLHIKDALAVSTLTPVNTAPPGRGEESGVLVRCPCFTLRRLTVVTRAELSAPADRFCHLLCVSGSLAVDAGAGRIEISAGGSVFLCAGEHAVLEGTGTLLAAFAGEV